MHMKNQCFEVFSSSIYGGHIQELYGTHSVDWEMVQLVAPAGMVLFLEVQYYVVFALLLMLSLLRGSLSWPVCSC